MLTQLLNHTPKLIDLADCKRASVGIIFRSKRHHEILSSGPSDLELLYIRRQTNAADRWSGHVAFPGGKADKDEDDQTCCEREIYEEIGLDVASDSFRYLGRLDDRLVKFPATAKTAMVLCCFVYLQVCPDTPRMHLNSSEVASTHWVPCDYLMDKNKFKWEWQPVYFPIYRQIMPTRFHRHAFVKYLLHPFLSHVIGGFEWFGIPIPGADDKALPLWGLTLWMTLDCLTILSHHPESFKTRMALDASPRYSSLDVDILVKALSFGRQPIEAFIHRSRVGLGIPILWIIRMSVVFSLFLKGGMSYLLFRLVRRLFIARL